MVCFLLCSSAVRVHGSQAHKKMDVTKEHISHILELTEMLLLFQTDFNLINAAVICAILESILGLKPSSGFNWAQVLESFDCLKLLPIYFDLLVDATGVGLLSTDLHAVEVLLRCSTNFARFSSSPAKPGCHQWNRDWWLFCLKSWQCLWPKASVMILSGNMLKRMGESQHPRWTPTVL